MKAHTLAKLLLNMPDHEVTILDGFNGGGDPRTINLGPSVRNLNETNVKYDTDDIETQNGDIIALGYGCY